MGGRLCVWTQSAFNALERHFGSGRGVASTKKGYRLQNEVVSSADLSGIINSDAIQSVVRDQRQQTRRTRGTKSNPLVNRRAMAKLNPYSTVLREIRKKQAGVKRKISKQERKDKAKRSNASRQRMQKLLSSVNQLADDYTEVYREQVKSMNVK